MNNTYSLKEKDIERQWHLLDAEGQVLGRLASRIATILRGKHKPTFTPHLDAGDYVVVVNAEKIRLTGNKLDQKMHYRHSNQPGNLKAISYRTILSGGQPEKAILLAVKGMLPHNRLGRQLITKLKVYRGAEHPHQAQVR